MNEKMTIKLNNLGEYDNQWIKGVNTKIFHNYKIIDFIADFDKNSQYYVFKDDKLVLNEDYRNKNLFINLKDTLLKKIENISIEREYYGYEVDYNGLILLQPFTPRDKELIQLKITELKEKPNNYLFKWYNFKDIITKENRIVNISKELFILIFLEGAEFIDKLLMSKVKTIAELQKLKTIEELEYFNYELYFSIFLKEQGV